MTSRRVDLCSQAGSDAIASIKFDLAAGQPTTGAGLDDLAGITWSLSGDGLTLTGSIGATPVLTLVLSGQLTAAVGGTASPTVTATLLSEFPHQNLPDADTLTISGIKVVALDSDGTGLVAATISVQVIDDAPVQTAATEAQTVYEDLLADGNPDTPPNPADVSAVATGTLAGLVSFGADQPGTITLSPTTSGLPQNLTSIGAPVVYNVTGDLADGVC